MATYTVTGHPLNYNDMPEAVRAGLMTLAVGQTLTVVLTGPDDAKVKGHGVLK